MLAGALVAALAAGGASAQSLRINNAEKVAPLSVAKTEDLALNVHAVEDAAERRAVRALAETNMLGLQLRARQAVFSDFVSGLDSFVADPLTSRSELQVDRKLSLAHAPAVSFGGGFAHETYESGASTLKASSRVASQLFDRPLANTIRWTLARDGATETHELIDGTLMLQESLGPSRLRATVNYQGAPIVDVMSYGLAGDMPLAASLIGRFGVEHLHAADRGMAYNVGFNVGG
ncbi:MAG TPA: hypothetical protein VJ924_09645, partial [Alphaproteobacteria bacterium]|nr:hypothetical protein [Alphaproteobacteria bacterium]